MNFLKKLTIFELKLVFFPIWILWAIYKGVFKWLFGYK